MSDDDQISATITTGNSVSGSVSSTAQSLTANIDSEGILTVDKFQVSPEGLQLGNLANVDNTNLPNESVLFYDQPNSIWKSSTQPLGDLLEAQRPTTTEFKKVFGSSEPTGTFSDALGSNSPSVGEVLPSNGEFANKLVISIPGNPMVSTLEASAGSRRKRVTANFKFLFTAYGFIYQTNTDIAVSTVDIRVQHQEVGTPVSRFIVQSKTQDAQSGNTDQYVLKIAQNSTQPVGIRSISVNGKIALGNIGSLATQFLPIMGYHYYDGFGYLQVIDDNDDVSVGDTIFYSETSFTAASGNSSSYATQHLSRHTENLLLEDDSYSSNTSGSMGHLGKYVNIPVTIEMPASQLEQKVYFDVMQYFNLVLGAGPNGEAGRNEVRLIEISGITENY